MCAAKITALTVAILLTAGSAWKAEATVTVRAEKLRTAAVKLASPIHRAGCNTPDDCPKGQRKWGWQNYCSPC
jgi:hypothetical protein